MEPTKVYRAGQDYVSSTSKPQQRPIKLSSESGGTFRAGQDFVSKSQLNTNEDLYQLAQRAGLGEEADTMIRKSGGENQKYMSGGFIMDAMDVLNTGSYGFVGLFKGKGFIEGIKNRETLSEDDALGKYGWQGKIAGFLGDIILDPLTYVAPAKIVLLNTAGFIFPNVFINFSASAKIDSFLPAILLTPSKNSLLTAEP